MGRCHPSKGEHMTHEELIHTAMKAGAISYSPPPIRAVAGVSFTYAQLQRFADIVAEGAAFAEREACAKACEDAWTRHACAAAIRARGQPPQEALYGMNQDDWKDVVAAISKVRDGRGIYLACRPADVFKDWFLALGTAKVKEKK